MGFFKTAPMRYLLLVTGAWLVIFLLTRSVLLITHLDEVGGNLLPVFGVGLLYDLGFLAYAALPLGLYLLLCPPALWRRRGHRWFLQAVLTVSLFAMLFTSVAEWLFWDEFGVRFNFIAVDYLVYSDEVLNNLLESYPIGKLLSLLAMLAIVLSAGLNAVLVAAELALESGPRSGRVSAEHVLNILSRLNAAPAPENAQTALQVATPPLADTAHYDGLRTQDVAEEIDHA